VEPPELTQSANAGGAVTMPNGTAVNVNPKIR
jgi:hypothetical protein